MESLYSKEKRLETILDKLKSLSGSTTVQTSEIEQLSEEKNQLQSEKIELEIKYNDLFSK